MLENLHSGRFDKDCQAIARCPNKPRKTIMHHNINAEETALLGTEIELLMRERQSLLKVAGAAASLIAELHSGDLPATTVEAADLLAESVNALPEETLQDALTSIHARISA
jgi:hypothetical protein